MNLTLLVASFVLVAVAELGDKTQIAVITLSSRFKAFSVFSGAMLAFLLNQWDRCGNWRCVDARVARILDACHRRGHLSDLRSLHDYLKKRGSRSQDKGGSQHSFLFFLLGNINGARRQDPVCCDCLRH